MSKTIIAGLPDGDTENGRRTMETKRTFEHQEMFSTSVMAVRRVAEICSRMKMCLGRDTPPTDGFKRERGAQNGKKSQILDQ